MSDGFQPIGGEGASTGAPILSGAYGVVEPAVAPPVEPRSSKLPFIAAVLGSLLLLGGGGFFALTAASASGGAETPTAVVDALLEAAGNEDFITMAELVEPGERRVIVQPIVTDLMPELVRLGMFERAPNPSKVEGLDVEFTDVEYRIDAQPGHPDLVFVYFTGGSVSTRFDASELPFTGEFRDEYGDDFDEPEASVEELADESEALVLVERNGRWYVSGLFTIAEAARSDRDELPLASEAPPALGAPSPEEAVELMIGELVELDVAGMIGRTDPEEMAALYRYSPLFLDEAQADADDLLREAAADGVSWSVTDLDIEAETTGDDASVLVRGFTMAVDAPDTDFDLTYGPTQITGTLVGDASNVTWNIRPDRWQIDGVADGYPIDVDVTISDSRISGSATSYGDSVTFEVDVDPEGNCSSATVTENGETETIECLEDSLGPLSWYRNSFEQWSKEFPGVPFAAHRTEGEWYVSPIGSTFDFYVNSLKRIEDGAFSDIESMEYGVYALTPISPWYLYYLGASLTDPYDYEDDYYEEVDLDYEEYNAVVTDDSATVEDDFEAINEMLAEEAARNAVEATEAASSSK